MRIKLFAVALAAVVLVPAVSSSAEEECPIHFGGKFTERPVSVISTFTYAEHSAMVVFKDVSLNAARGPLVADVIVCANCRNNIRIKVRPDLSGNALSVTLFRCDYDQGRIFEVWGDDATLYVPSNAEKSRWKSWLRDYLKAEKKKREEARQEKFKPLVLPPIDPSQK